MQGIPDCTRRLVLGKLPENVFRHRGQEDAEDQLVLSEPPKVLRVGDLALSITRPFREEHGGCSIGAGDEAKELMGLEHRDGLSLPRAGIDMATAKKKRNKWWREDLGSGTM